MSNGRGMCAALILFGCAGAVSWLAGDGSLPKDEGYRGIWYFNQPSKDEYKYKYSGGFATYPQQHAPIAIYAPAAKKTRAASSRSSVHPPAKYGM